MRTTMREYTIMRLPREFKLGVVDRVNHSVIIAFTRKTKSISTRSRYVIRFHILGRLDKNVSIYVNLLSRTLDRLIFFVLCHLYTFKTIMGRTATDFRIVFY